MADIPGVPAGTTLRVRTTGVPRLSITQTPGSGGLLLRTQQRPILTRTPGLPGAPGPPGGVETVYFSGSGREEPRAGDHPVYLEGAYSLESVRAAVGTPPLGSPLTVDILRGNGDGPATSIYTDPAYRPSIAPLTKTALGYPAAVIFVAGDYLQCDVVAVGVTFPGENLVVTVRLLRTG